MKSPSFRDVEQLSAYLDGELSGAGRSRLDSRLGSEPALGLLLEELRQTRAVLRRTPGRRAPRNFTLTPKMAGLRPPVPRAVPALSWASAVAMLLFVCTLGTSLLGRLSFGAAAPMSVAEASGRGGENASDSTTQAYGIGGGPPAGTAVPVQPEASLLPTSTPELLISQAPPATPEPTERIPSDQFSTPENPRRPVNPWLLVWFGLAAALIGTALVIRWAAVQKFRKRAGTQK